VFAIGGVFWTFPWYEPFIGSVVLVVFTFFAPLISPDLGAIRLPTWAICNLSNTNVSGTILSSAELYSAYLSDATGETNEQLAEAKSLEGATMPDGSKHD
jgi:uncharacterized protein YjbI with pentapeptide repeats